MQNHSSHPNSIKIFIQVNAQPYRVADARLAARSTPGVGGCVDLALLVFEQVENISAYL
jgi:hypothetical protein